MPVRLHEIAAMYLIAASREMSELSDALTWQCVAFSILIISSHFAFTFQGLDVFSSSTNKIYHEMMHIMYQL